MIPSILDVARAQIVSLDPAIRKIGAQTLSRLLPISDISLIRSSFREERIYGVAKWMALYLGRVKDYQSLEILEKRLQVLPDCDLRDWIIVSIALIRGTTTEKDIINRLKSSDSSVKKEGVILSWEHSKLRISAVKSLHSMLENSDPNVRRWAILSLGAREDFQISETILEHLDDPDPLTLEWTEHVITGKVPRKALPNLVKNLSHVEPSVRRWAIKALASSCADGIFSVLIDHYKTEPDKSCRDAVIRSLSPVGETPEIHDFLTEIIRRETDPFLLAALIHVTSKCPNLREDECFIELLINKVAETGDSTLQLGIEQCLTTQLDTEEISLINKFSVSHGAKKALDLLSNLPWEEKTQNHNLSKTKNSNKMNAKTNDYVAAILIAKKEEFRYFLELFPGYEAKADPDSGKSFYHFTLQRPHGGTVQLIAMFVGGMGNERSALLAAKMIEAKQPSLIASIGIAGGISQDVILGDVVIATQVENYLADAKAVRGVKKGEYHFQLAGDAFKTDAFLVNAAQNFEFSHSVEYNSWQEHCEVASKEIADKQRLELQSKLILRSLPIVEEGHVGSGPIVGAAEAFVSWLKNTADRSFLAIEMESAGAALAIHESAASTRHFVIRGISDFGDERKKELDGIEKGALRKLAMQNASRFLIAFLTHSNLK